MDFCDLNCEHASWPESASIDGSNSCRTFIALYCRKKKRHVHKNMPCNEKSVKLNADRKTCDSDSTS